MISLFIGGPRSCTVNGSLPKLTGHSMTLVNDTLVIIGGVDAVSAWKPLVCQRMMQSFLCNFYLVSVLCVQHHIEQVDAVQRVPAVRRIHNRACSRIS